jgi:hypothetical protein
LKENCFCGIIKALKIISNIVSPKEIDCEKMMPILLFAILLKGVGEQVNCYRRIGMDNAAVMMAQETGYIIIDVRRELPQGADTASARYVRQESDLQDRWR